MSRFAVLHSDGSEDDEGPDGIAQLTPQYTMQQILSYAKAGQSQPAPPELAKFDNIFMKEPQRPECEAFHPPQSEINSVPFTKPPRNTPQNPRRGAAASPPQRTHQKETRKKAAQSKTEGARREAQGPSDTVMWVYRDPTGAVFGPFASERMRDWMNRKFFDASLQIKVAGSDAPFMSVSATFPDLAQAFVDLAGPKFAEMQGWESKLSTLFSFSVDDQDDDRAWEAIEKSLIK